MIIDAPLGHVVQRVGAHVERLLGPVLVLGLGGVDPEEEVKVDGLRELWGLGEPAHVGVVAANELGEALLGAALRFTLKCHEKHVSSKI